MEMEAESFRSETPVGIVSNASRNSESMRLSILKGILHEDMTIQTSVIVLGDSSTLPGTTKWLLHGDTATNTT